MIGKSDEAGLMTVSAAQVGEVARLQEENAHLKAELRREHEMNIRNLADFDKFHRRAERERAQAAQAGKRALILGLLDLMDELDRPGEGRPAAEVLRDCRRRLAALLAAEGVTAFESVGQRFTPTRHEAIASVAGSGAEPGTVIEEVRRGYYWGAELLRAAQVRVAQ